MNKTENVLSALKFLRSFIRSYKLTSIATNDEEDIINQFTESFCKLDNIKRSNYVDSDKAMLLNLANSYSDFDISNEVIAEELSFLYQLINEVSTMIKQLTQASGREYVTDLLAGLDEISTSMVLGNPTFLDTSGLGIGMATIDLLSHRFDYRRIYTSYSHSTPLAKYFIVSNALTRSTACQLQNLTI